MTVSLPRHDSNYGWCMLQKSTVKLAAYIPVMLLVSLGLRCLKAIFGKSWSRLNSFAPYNLLMSCLDPGLKLCALPSVSALNYVPWIAHNKPRDKNIRDHAIESAYLFTANTELSDFSGDSFDIYASFKRKPYVFFCNFGAGEPYLTYALDMTYNVSGGTLNLTQLNHSDLYFSNLGSSENTNICLIIINNPSHLLFPLLPPIKQHYYNMRKHSHDHELPNEPMQ